MECDSIDSLRKKREIKGLEKYGPINVATDPRVFCDEIQEELADALNYLDWAFQRDELEFEDFSLCDKCIRLAYSLVDRRKKAPVRREPVSDAETIPVPAEGENDTPGGPDD